mgnify:CR=1 FL=1
MKANYIGYPCMNRNLRDRDPPLRANRSLRRKTLESKGLEYVSELVQKNLTDLQKILEWNVEHNIYFYRCTSELVPWNAEYKLEELPEFQEIQRLFVEIGSYIKSHNIRFTFHPDHYVKLASPTDSTVDGWMRWDSHGHHFIA